MSKLKEIFNATSMSLAMLICLLLGAAAQADDVVPSERVKNSVKVRVEPSGGGTPFVGTLNRGERAEYLESVPYYHRIKLNNGVIGYVSKSWTKVVGGQGSTGASGLLELHFMDVGQGDSTLIECPNGNKILIDSGSVDGASPDDIRQYFVSALEPDTLAINYLVVSHPDADHYNLLDTVLDGIPVDHAFFVGRSGDYRYQSVFDFLNHGTEKRTHFQRAYHDPMERPNELIDCGEAKVWVLAAGVYGSDSRKNAMSIVLMVRYDEFEAVITGDATFATERYILKQYDEDWLNIDLLRVGHHGSSTTSTSDKWARVLSPEIAVVSASYGNGYGHPRATVIDRLRPYTDNDAMPHPMRDGRRPTQGERGYQYETHEGETEQIYTTSTNGNIVVTTDGSAAPTITLNAGNQ